MGRKQCSIGILPVVGRLAWGLEYRLEAYATGKSLNQHFGLRIEQTRLGHINAERHRLADRGRRVWLEAGDNLAAVDADNGYGLCAGRFDNLDRRFNRAEMGCLFRPATIVADEVFRPQ